MKKLTFLLVTLFISSMLSAQIAYSPLVDDLIDEVTEVTISDLLEKLSGEVPVMIGGTQYTIESRHSYSSFNPLAAQWIYEQFEDMGIPVEYHYFNTNGENVVATITGSMYPDQQYIVCAHYDDMPSGNLAPGADDNASGVVGVLETARLIKDYDLKYTVKFIAFDEEEQGLIGSYAYANEAGTNGDDILGVLNLDMIAYESNGDMEMSISTNSQSAEFTNTYTSVLGTYDLNLTYNYISTGASDHSPFWANGYQAILAIEDWNDFNAYYHTTNDLFSNCNIPYFQVMVQSAVATMACLSMDMKMELIHDPIVSGDDTGDREAVVEINTSHVIGSGAQSPRLYYSVDDGAFTELQPYNSVTNTYYFSIPGQPMGSKIEYYLAAQDDASTLMATLPAGGRGLDPPGSIAPESFFTYIIADINTMTACSSTLPKNINDLQNLYDTITISHEGILIGLDVQLDAIHTYDGDVEIYLIGPDGTEIDLCVGHGGSGNNFIGTVFDDDAATPIAQGSAPFTGSYIPDQPLATYNDMSITGDWIIRIFDNAQNDQGKLTNWCLNLQYSGDPVYIASYEQREAVLHQNYPNPFIGETTFAFELHRSGHVQIEIIDMMGRQLGMVTDQDYPSGKHNIRWNAGSLPQGRYFYRIQTDQNVEVKSMMIAK